MCSSVHGFCACAQARCQEVRKKKDLELQILTEPIRNWEGDDIRTLGPVLHMSQATVHTQNCQVLRHTHFKRIFIYFFCLNFSILKMSA